MQATTIGLDIAKNVFQVHGIDAQRKDTTEPSLAQNAKVGTVNQEELASNVR